MRCIQSFNAGNERAAASTGQLTRQTADPDACVTPARFTRWPKTDYGYSDPLADLQIPDALQASVARHRQNLEQFAQSLRCLGMDDGQIEDSLSVIADSYRVELDAALQIMVR